MDSAIAKNQSHTVSMCWMISTVDLLLAIATIRGESARAPGIVRPVLSAAVHYAQVSSPKLLGISALHARPAAILPAPLMAMQCGCHALRIGAPYHPCATRPMWILKRPSARMPGSGLGNLPSRTGVCASEAYHVEAATHQGRVLSSVAMNARI